MKYEDEILKEGMDCSREKLAAFMIAMGYSTGHGDTIEDLLKELGEEIDAQIDMHINDTKKYKERIEAAITNLHLINHAYHYPDEIGNEDDVPSLEEVIATLEGSNL